MYGEMQICEICGNVLPSNINNEEEKSDQSSLSDKLEKEFAEITETNTHIARNFLKRTGNNLSNAISLYYSSDDTLRFQSEPPSYQQINEHLLYGFLKGSPEITF